MTTFFTADLHFGHAKILTHHPARGESLDEMHGRIVSNWNATVGRNDDVHVLGDFFLGPASEVAGWFHVLNGKKHLVVGNHDNGATIMSTRRYLPVDGHGDGGS